MTHDKICETLESVKQVLLEKNRRYGDSASHPVRVFSNLDAEQGLLVRLDDKLKRIMNSDELRKNDVFDVLGYLVLLCVQKGWCSFDEFVD